MKLSEYKGDDALDILADLIEPATEILTDLTVRKLLEKKEFAKATSKAIKNHKKAVTTIVALLQGEDPETYKPNVLTVPAVLLDVLNDPMIMELFFGQEQMSGEDTSFSSAVKNAEGKA